MPLLTTSLFPGNVSYSSPITSAIHGVPSEVLNPRNTWKDGAAYDAKAKELAAKFRANDKKFDMPEAVRNAGPKA